MITDEHADRSAPPDRPWVRIVQLTGPVYRALADGDLATANATSPVPLSEAFVDPDWAGVWRMRSSQVAADPASADWVTGVIWDERRQLAVGRAGYHGPPDAAGMVEIGYTVDPAYRRRGYARAALEALLQRAAREPGVRTVRVSISPENDASHRLASQYGFTKVGEEWDDEDGLEFVYEVDADRYPSLEGLLLVAVVEMAPGRAADGQRYEDAVLGLLARHGGTVERRLRSTDDSATEVHVIRFDSRAGYESFLVDPDRLAHRDQLGDAAPTTRVIEVRDR